MLTTYRDGLLYDTLPFWLTHCVDHEFGGFMTALDQTGKVVDTDKSVWQQGRFTWLLGELYNQVEPHQPWLDLALHGVQFIDQHCVDADDGRMFFQVTREGQPIRKRRYAYSESFAAIAYGELAKATQDPQFSTKAQRTFERFVRHNENPQGVQPKFTNVRPTRSLGFPMILIVTAQELRDSIGLADANQWIDYGIAQIREFHIKEDLQCVLETVGSDGQIIDHFDGRTLNPGHAIEAAWFIMEEGQYRNDTDLIQLGCKMLDWMWLRGWDQKHGGLLYFTDLYDLPVQEYWHDMKFWWPHNEAIIATLMAYVLTGQAKYATWHQLVHEWAFDHFPDRDGQEWFGYLHRDGRISSTLKGNLWKGPFHLPRMQLRCWKLMQRLVLTDSHTETDT